MRFAIAGYFDEELTLQIVEAADSTTAVAKFAAEVMGFDSLDVEDEATADDYIAALSEEGCSVDWLVIS